MDSIEYKKLYELQDKVMDIVFEVENIFYLTGGTYLSRFHQEKRYSDDLDFFAQDESRFHVAIKNIKQALKIEFKVIVKMVDCLWLIVYGGWLIVMSDYKELNVWKESIDLVESVYKLVKILPKKETYALSDQLRRAVVSMIQANTINYQQSTINQAPSTINQAPSTINQAPSTINHKDFSMKILVTGTAGFIGYHLAKKIVKKKKALHETR